MDGGVWTCGWRGRVLMYFAGVGSNDGDSRFPFAHTLLDEGLDTP